MNSIRLWNWTLEVVSEREFEVYWASGLRASLFREVKEK